MENTLPSIETIFCLYYLEEPLGKCEYFEKGKCQLFHIIPLKEEGKFQYQTKNEKKVVSIEETGYKVCNDFLYRVCTYQVKVFSKVVWIFSLQHEGNIYFN